MHWREPAGGFGYAVAGVSRTRRRGRPSQPVCTRLPALPDKAPSTHQAAGSSESKATLSTGPNVSKWHLISPAYLQVLLPLVARRTCKRWTTLIRVPVVAGVAASARRKFGFRGEALCLARPDRVQKRGAGHASDLRGFSSGPRLGRAQACARHCTQRISGRRTSGRRILGRRS